MPKTKEVQNKNVIKLNIKQNILLIINSIVVLVVIARIIFMYPYMLIAPLFLVVAIFCLIPLLKSTTQYSRAYIRAQAYLAAVAVVGLLYFAIQLIKDRTGVHCEGLMGSYSSCIDNMWLSAWVATIVATLPAAILCAYGAYTQFRLSK
jgi:hypothetical protein